MRRWGLRRSGSVGAALVMLTLVLLASVPIGAQEDLTEYQVKAAFIYNFTKFVEWPGEAFGSAGAPLRVCVLGDNLIGQELMRTVNGKKVNGHDLIVSSFSEPSLAKGCQVLFIGSAERARLAQVLQNLRGATVLTVGETGEFIRGGGIIRLLMEEGKVRFEVNLAASERARLKISAKLLSLARNVWTSAENN